MDVRPTALPGVVEFVPKKFSDSRGFFSETYSQAAFSAAGIEIGWVQDNQSYSAEQHVLRGLHFQIAPAAQDKLVRVLRGAICDVAVDIRKASPTFGQWVAVELSAAKWNQLLVPKGFAHGFLTLEPGTEVFYKVSARYSAAHDRTIRFDDQRFGVAWPLNGATPILSDKDRNAPVFADIAAAIDF